jgi:hypothetical protein
MRIDEVPPSHSSDFASTSNRGIIVDMDDERALLERITINPGVCGGRPCIRGYRMRVSDILDLIGAGASFEEIL